MVGPSSKALSCSLKPSLTLSHVEVMSSGPNYFLLFWNGKKLTSLGKNKNTLTAFYAVRKKILY